MGTSQAEKARSRERILKQASRLIRERGVDNVSVNDLMKAANLTHGGFYGHFKNRGDMIAAGLERALEDSARALYRGVEDTSGKQPSAVAARYLDPLHRDHPERGCAVAAVAGEVAREDERVREVMAEGVARSIERMSEACGGGDAAKKLAMSSWSMMIGSLVLSRIFKGEPISEDLLSNAKEVIAHLETEMAGGQEGKINDRN